MNTLTIFKNLGSMVKSAIGNRALPAPQADQPEAEEDFAGKIEAFRRAMGKPERFLLSCACAVHDRGFTVIFERFSPGKAFRIAKIEKHTGGGESGRASLRTMEADALDCAGWACPWCGDARGFVVCNSCGDTPVCSGRVQNRDGKCIFQCREICGASGETMPLQDIKGAEDTSERTPTAQTRPPPLSSGRLLDKLGK